MKIIWFIIHGIFGCPDKDLIPYKNLKFTCKKCSRVYFNFMKY